MSYYGSLDAKISEIYVWYLQSYTLLFHSCQWRPCTKEQINRFTTFINTCSTLTKLKNTYLPSLDCFNFDRNIVARASCTQHLSAQLELDTLLSEDTLEGLGHLTIDTETSDAAHELDGSNLGAQARPHWALTCVKQCIKKLLRVFAINVKVCSVNKQRTE